MPFVLAEAFAGRSAVLIGFANLWRDIDPAAAIIVMTKICERRTALKATCRRDDVNAKDISDLANILDIRPHATHRETNRLTDEPWLSQNECGQIGSRGRTSPFASGEDRRCRREWEPVAVGLPVAVAHDLEEVVGFACLKGDGDAAICDAVYDTRWHPLREIDSIADHGMFPLFAKEDTAHQQ